MEGHVVDNIVFYGERGLIDSLVLDLHKNTNLLRAFLKEIVFLGIGSTSSTTPPMWPEKPSATFYIEPHFAQFGSPDLIITFDNIGGIKQVLFFEAKLKGYVDSAASIGPSFSYQGNASEINVQLALRYRFAKAYLLGHGQEIVESDELHPNGDKRRSLKRQYAVNYVNSAFGENCDFYFIAMTNDRLNASITHPYLPPIDEWDAVRSKFGIITYHAIAKVFKNVDSHFLSTIKNVIGLPKSDHLEKQEVKSVGFEAWSTKQKKFADAITRSIESREPNGKKIRVKGNEKSYSIIVGTFTAGKVIVDSVKGDLIVGFRDDYISESMREDLPESLIIQDGKHSKSYACQRVSDYSSSSAGKSADIALLYSDLLNAEPEFENKSEDPV
jgi:hypothetical protein